MKESVDQKGNLIFEINSREIIISICKLRILTGTNILSVSGIIESLDGRVCHKGEALREEKGKGWIYLNLKKIVEPKNKNSIIRRKIIEILSHEARHIAQGPSKSKFLKFYRKLDAIFFLPLIIMSVSNLIAQIILSQKEFNIPIYMNILLFFPAIFLLVLQIFYLFDPEEMNAREASERAIQDKRWLKIVKVKTIK